MNVKAGLVLFASCRNGNNGYRRSAFKVQWQIRVLVINSPTTNDVGLMKQRRIYVQALSGMAGQDIILVEVIGNEAVFIIYPQRLGIISKNLFVLLVGNDGNVAMPSIEPPRPEILFRATEAIPMRQD